MGAEWIDLPLASVDAVLCRWGYMLLADPVAALGETRRVLRPGGRLSLAVWDDARHNPWATLPMLELIERGLAAPPADGEPGPFALGDAGRLRALLEQAGFAQIDVQQLDIEHRHPSVDAFWETTLDVARRFHDAVLEPAEAARSPRFAPVSPYGLRRYTSADGALAIPGRTLVASATA